jgi:hypothetical protein
MPNPPHNTAAHEEAPDRPAKSTTTRRTSAALNRNPAKRTQAKALSKNTSTAKKAGAKKMAKRGR